MNSERPGCLRFLGPLAKYFAVKDDPQKLNTRFVKSTEVTIEPNGKTKIDEIQVELTDGMPDEVAQQIARVYRSGKAMVGSYNEKTGKWETKELD